MHGLVIFTRQVQVSYSFIPPGSLHGPILFSNCRGGMGCSFYCHLIDSLCSLLRGSMPIWHSWMSCSSCCCWTSHSSPSSWGYVPPSPLVASRLWQLSFSAPVSPILSSQDRWGFRSTYNAIQCVIRPSRFVIRRGSICRIPCRLARHTFLGSERVVPLLTSLPGWSAIHSKLSYLFPRYTSVDPKDGCMVSNLDPFRVLSDCSPCHVVCFCKGPQSSFEHNALSIKQCWTFVPSFLDDQVSQIKTAWR